MARLLIWASGWKGKRGLPVYWLIWVFPLRSWIRRSADLVLCVMDHWICAWIPARGLSAAEWIASAAEADIAQVIKEYGEERFARRMAAAVVRSAQLRQLLALCSWRRYWPMRTRPGSAAGIRPPRHFRRSEYLLIASWMILSALLGQVIDLLQVGGRLVVISFHSLEDRRGKAVYSRSGAGHKLPKNLPVRDVDRGVRLRKIGKAVKPARH